MPLKGHHNPEANYSVLEELYDASREYHGRPVSLAIAEVLTETVEAGDTVLISTGTGGPPNLPKGETDGPLGAVGLAHGLALGLGARPVLVTEERRREFDRGPFEACAHACGLNMLPYDQLRERKNAIAFATFPEDDGAADRFLEEYDPSAVIATESWVRAERALRTPRRDTLSTEAESLRSSIVRWTTQTLSRNRRQWQRNRGRCHRRCRPRAPSRRRRVPVFLWGGNR